MPVEEDFDTSGTANDTVTRNFVGARGLEAISTTQNSVTNVSYPLYDVHGNMVATLTKNTAGTSWSVGDERSYDVWGSVRSGTGPKNAYVANLGHVQDDESGLIYMRARYYEPESGRFVNVDVSKDGANWYIYGKNNPIESIDPSGESAVNVMTQSFIYGLLFGFFSSVTESLLFGGGWDSLGIAAKTAFISGASAYFMAFIGVNYFGTEGLGSRFPLRAGGVKMGSLLAAGGGIGIGVAIYFGIRGGQMLFELFMMEYTQTDQWVKPY
jgi:RHS repeat-associated protein